MTQLTSNAIRQIYDDVSVEPSLIDPIVQVINIKKLPAHSPDSPDRYRLIISDGTLYMQGKNFDACHQFNDIITSNQLVKNSIIRLTKYSCNAVQNRRIAIILVTSVVGIAERIGNPAPLNHQQILVHHYYCCSCCSCPAPVSAAPPTTNTSTAPISNPYAPSNNPPTARSSTNAPSSMSANTMSRAGEPADLHPISSINPYQNKWTIRARVLSKSDIRTWKNARGEGKLFNVTFLDESGEIRGTAFRDQVDQFYPMLEENKIYYVSNARVNIAKQQFSNVQNSYELTFESGTQIRLCPDSSAVPSIRFNFVRIADLINVEKDAIVDVIGVVKEAQELSQIISKTTQRPLVKRELTLVDESQYAVRLTLWGNQAETYNQQGEPVIAFKGVRVGDFQGRSLSMLSSAIMAINPDIQEAHRLRGWYDAQGAHATFSSFAGASMGASGSGMSSSRQNNYKTFEQIKEENIGTGDKADYFNVKGVITKFRDNMYYPACPGENCNKKVSAENDGSWFCEKCQRSYGSPEYRYILGFNVSDISGQSWLQSFNEAGIQLLGRTADELEQLRVSDEMAYRAAVQGALFKSYTFRCRAKEETYNEMQRVRISAVDAVPVEPVAYGKLLLEWIKAYQ
ncbi:replication factor A 1 [Syncephalis plumigaleata]|nr:replication factor A 1 [Syncephalis plumigaleata]